MVLKKIVFVLFALLLAGASFAVEFNGSFEVECSCLGPKQETYALVNDSDKTQTFFISAEGENSEWINMNGQWISEDPIIVTLSAGESENFYAFIRPKGCYVVPGMYEFTINVKNGETLSKTMKVRVLETRALSLKISKDDNVSGQCLPQSFELEVSNNSVQDEYVSLDIDGLPKEWIKLSSERFMVNKNSSRTAVLQVQAPCGQEAGAYRFEVTASMEGTPYTVTKSSEFEILDVQEISLTVADVEACREENISYEFELTNSGGLSDELEIKLFGPSWISIEENKISISGNSSEKFVLNIAENISAQEEIPVKIVVSSKKYNKEYEEDLIVFLKDCYNLVAEGIQTPEKGCVEENPVFKVKFSNDSLKEVSADLKVEGILADLSKQSISLAPNSEQIVDVTVDFEGEIGNKRFNLLVDGEFFDALYGFNISSENCYDISVDYAKLVNSIDLNAGESKSFSISVLNSGTREQTASVTFTGLDWVYASPRSLSLVPGEIKQVYVFVNPLCDLEEGNYQALASVFGRDHESSQLVNFNVYSSLPYLLEGIEIGADSEAESLLSETEHSAEVSIFLSNDSNSFVRVNNVQAVDFNAVVVLDKKLLAPGESTSGKVTLYLGTDVSEKRFPVTLEINTDKGTLNKIVIVDLSEAEAKSPLTGYALLETGKTIAIVLLVILLLALLAYLNKDKIAEKDLKKTIETKKASTKKKTRGKK